MTSRFSRLNPIIKSASPSPRPLCRLFQCCACVQGYGTGRVLVERDGEWVYLPRSSLNEDRYRPATKRSSRSTAPATVAPRTEAAGAIAEALSTDERPKVVAKAPVEQQTFHGVEIPARPLPPASDECCMSGCARCIYDLYAEDLQDYQSALVDARTALRAKDVDVSTWPSILQARATDSRSDAVKRAEEEAAADVAQLNLDVSMREFLHLERTIRRRNLDRLAASGGADGLMLQPGAFTAASSTPLRRVSKPA